MSWRIGSQSKVAGRADQPAIEMPCPNAIYKDAGGKRIVGTGNGVSQFATTAADLKRLARRPAQQLQKLARYIVSQSQRIAPQEHARLNRLLQVHQRERHGDRCRRVDQPAIHFALQFPKLRDGSRVEKGFTIRNWPLRNAAGRRIVIEYSAKRFGGRIGQLSRPLLGVTGRRQRRLPSLVNFFKHLPVNITDFAQRLGCRRESGNQAGSSGLRIAACQRTSRIHRGSRTTRGVTRLGRE